MIASLTGNVIHRDLTWLIIDVAGVGYQVYVPGRIDAPVGTSCTLFCSHQVREDSETLYGFVDLAERALFELLITVSGVGPKSGLAIISASPIDRIHDAIAQADTALFEATPGIGKKVAAKIIVELKGKLVESFTGGSGDLLAALEGLGYRRPEILTVMRELPAEMTDTGEQIRWALARLSK